MTVDELINELLKAKKHGVLGTDPVEAFMLHASGLSDLRIRSIHAINTNEVDGKAGSVSIEIIQT